MQCGRIAMPNKGVHSIYGREQGLEPDASSGVRRWAEQCLLARAASIYVTWPDHTSPKSCIAAAFSPDGALLATTQ